VDRTGSAKNSMMISSLRFGIIRSNRNAEFLIDEILNKVLISKLLPPPDEVTLIELVTQRQAAPSRHPNESPQTLTKEIYDKFETISRIISNVFSTEDI